MVSFESFLNTRGGSLSILFFSRKSFVSDSGILTDSIELILFPPSCLELNFRHYLFTGQNFLQSISLLLGKKLTQISFSCFGIRRLYKVNTEKIS